MKYFSFLLSILIITVIGYAGYYFYNQTYEEAMLEIQNNPPSLNIPSAPPEATQAAIVATDSAIPAEWKTYISSQEYSIRFPKDMQNNISDEGDRYFYLGPTQTLGTELFDGISLLISSKRLNKKTLQQTAKEKHDNLAKEEITEKISIVKPVTYGDHKGFQFQRSALGDFNYIYIPQSGETYLEIVSMVVGPEETVGRYEDMTEKIITSISF